MPAVRHDDILLRLIKDVNNIRSALRRVTVNLPLFDIANENSPTQFTGDQDNYVIGNYDLLRLSGSQAISITGLKGGIKGRFLRIFNVGSYPITLENQSASSDPENRFNFSNGQSPAIFPGSNLTIYYDSTQSRWIGGDTYSSGSIFANVRYSLTQDIPDGAAATKLSLDTVISDQYGFFVDADDRFVIPADGFYHVSLQAEFQDETGANDYLRAANILAYSDIGGLFGQQRDTKNQDVEDNNTRLDVNYYAFIPANYYIEFTANQESPTASALTIQNVFATIIRMT